MARLTTEQLAFIEETRWKYHEAYNGDLRVCDEVSYDIEQTLGFKMAAGYCDHDPGLFYHCWNLLPDGSILDATADQFGLNGITIVKKNSLEYKYYEACSKRLASVLKDLRKDRRLVG